MLAEGKWHDRQPMQSMGMCLVALVGPRRTVGLDILPLSHVASSAAVVIASAQGVKGKCKLVGPITNAACCTRLQALSSLQLFIVCMTLCR